MIGGWQGVVVDSENARTINSAPSFVTLRVSRSPERATPLSRLLPQLDVVKTAGPAGQNHQRVTRIRYVLTAHAVFVRVPIAIKSLCDFADATKSDDWQEYAAFTGARFFDILIRSGDFPMPD